MSTKTTLKRIALVAVSALGIGLFSTVTPANAAISAAWSGMYDATNKVGIIGGSATVTLTLDTSTVNTVVVSGVGSVISSTTDGTNATHTAPVPASGQVLYGPLTTWRVTVDADGTGTDAIVLTSATAGTTTVSVTPVVSGIPGTTKSYSMTWVAASSAALSSDNTTIAIVSSRASGCVYNASLAVQNANVAAYARTGMSYADTSGTRAAFVCIIARDGSGNTIDFEDLDTVIVSLSKGSLASGSIARVDATETYAKDNAGSATLTDDKEATFKLYGDGLFDGASTISVTLIEGSTVVSKSLTFNFYSEVTSVTLNQITASGAAADATWFGSDYTDATSAATKSDTTVAFTITCKDANGLTVSNCDNNGNGSGSDTVYYIVDSDGVAGSPTFSATAPASTTDAQYVTVSASLGSTATAVNAATSYVVVDGNSAYAGAQKLSIQVCLPNLLATGTPANICGSGTYYLAGSASTVTVSPASTSVAAGASTTVDVSVADAKGYPVADGTSVTLAATNGSVIAPSSKTTFNGSFVTPATFVAGSSSNSSLITAAVGSKSGTKLVTISGSSADSSMDATNAAADAAAEAIDAANAATDAANLAAEAADAATVAAEEARDAADAATAAVEELATQVATLMAALKAQITTLANTVAKIAKKVKA